MKKFLAAAAVLAASFAFALGVYAEDLLGRILAMEGQERLEFLQARSHEERVEFLEYFVTLGREEKLAFLESLTNDEIEEIRAPIVALVTRIFEEYGVLEDGSDTVNHARPTSAHKERDNVIMEMLGPMSFAAIESGALWTANLVLGNRLRSRLWRELEFADRAGLIARGDFISLGDIINNLEHDGEFQTLGDVLSLHRSGRGQEIIEAQQAIWAAQIEQWERGGEVLNEPGEAEEKQGDGAEPGHADVELFAATRIRWISQTSFPNVVAGMFTGTLGVDIVEAHNGNLVWGYVQYAPGREHLIAATLQALQGSVTRQSVIRRLNEGLRFLVTFSYAWWMDVGNHHEGDVTIEFHLPHPRSTGLRALPHGEDD